MVSITTGVINNVALLIVFSFVCDVVPLSRLRSKVLRDILKSLLVGLIGISIMYNPVILMPGIMFDGRSILLSISGLFFGPIITILSAIMMLALRIYQGGEGIYMGTMVIVSSSVLGLVMRKYRFTQLLHNKMRRWYELYIFGILVHLIMLFSTFLLPYEIRSEVFDEIAFTVLGIYPIGVLIFGGFLIYNLDRKNTEQKNISLFDYNSAVILVTSKTSKKVVDANNAAAGFLGYKKNDLLGMKTEFIIVNDRTKSIFNHLEKNNRSFAKIKTANGRIIDVQIHRYLTVIDNEELIYHIIADQTEYYKAKHDLILKNLVTNSITSIIQDIILIYDENFCIHDCSKSFEDFMKLEKGKIVGASIKEIINNRILDWLWIDEGIETINNEKIIKVCTKDGKTFFFAVLMSGFENNEIMYSGNIIIARDITHFKEREKELIDARLEAEKATRTQNKFLANMSHEIRTPLNGVIGMIDLTLMENLNNECVENLTIAKTSSKNLLSILNDILDYSKLDLNTVDCKKEYFYLKEFVTEMKQMYVMSAIHKGLKLEMIIDDGYPVQIKSDKVKLMQVISNLIGNGIKFTRVGKVILKIEHQYIINNEVTIKFRIIDTGIGIEPEKQLSLFESFSQGDGSYTRNFGGVGLGLAISKKVVDLLGGQINCESIYGEGSEFFLTMNFEYLCVEEESSIYVAKDKIEMTNSGTKEVLIVDDDIVNLKLLRLFLEKNGYVTTTAENGAVAVEKFKQKQFELILMDISMPVMDGIQATEVIRLLDEDRGQRTPILAVTAFALTDDREKFITAGLDDYITKPIDFDILIHKAEEWINKSKLSVKMD